MRQCLTDYRVVSDRIGTYRLCQQAPPTQRNATLHYTTQKDTRVYLLTNLPPGKTAGSLREGKMRLHAAAAPAGGRPVGVSSSSCCNGAWSSFCGGGCARFCSNAAIAVTRHVTLRRSSTRDFLSLSRRATSEFAPCFAMCVIQNRRRGLNRVS